MMAHGESRARHAARAEFRAESQMQSAEGGASHGEGLATRDEFPATHGEFSQHAPNVADRATNPTLHAVRIQYPRSRIESARGFLRLDRKLLLRPVLSLRNLAHLH